MLDFRHSCSPPQAGERENHFVRDSKQPGAAASSNSDPITLPIPVNGAKSGRLLVYLVCAAFAGMSSLAYAQASGVYASDLGTLYGERYALQAQKDACISVLPKSRAEMQKAYDEWLDRHEDLLEDLDARFRAMVKQASRDQKEYSRLFGKYQGAVISQRQEQKDAMLALPKDELLKLCKEFPGYFRSANSNIPAKYPDEFKTVYRKKPAAGSPAPDPVK